MTDTASRESEMDVLDLVVEDHEQIKRLMERVRTDGPAKAETFQRLVAKLATHETAEEEVVHPLARRGADNETIVEERLHEESDAKQALARLENLGVDAPEFGVEFETLRLAVLRHATAEEQQEHPKLRATTDEQQLRKAATVFSAAERIGPTHAHEHSPESATGNVLVGTFVAAADRARDALRNAANKDS